MAQRHELSVYQAVARIVWLMAQGGTYTTREIAGLMGRKTSTAYRCMIAIEASHHVPLRFDKETERWAIINLRT